MKRNEEYTDGWIGDPERDPLLPSADVLPSASRDFLYDQTKQIMGKMVDYKELRMVYACAIKEVKTKFEVLSTEFNLQHHRNPINAIQTRLKSTASIMEKLTKLHLPFTVQSVEENIHDVAGVRVICSYIDDIYLIADAFLKQDDVTLITKKDYITEPKPNGYRSLHLIVETPVFLADRRIDRKVEVQIRTIAMDFWASLEHQLHYKQKLEDQGDIVEQLKRCAETIHETDKEMQEIRMRMEALADTPTEDELLLERFSKIDMSIE